MPVFFKNRFSIGLSIACIMCFISLHVSAQESGSVNLSVSEYEVDDVAVPDAGELNTVDEVENIEDDDVVADDANTISAPTARVDVQDDFFDANDLFPQGEMAQKGPVKINPSTQPASKYIIVKKNYSKDTKTAHLISAERALSLGRNDSALEMFNALYEKNKRDPRVLMGRAVTLQKVERFDEAMQMYEELEAIEPKNIDVKINMLGLLSTRYPAVALRHLIELYQTNRNNVGVVSQLAIVYARTGDAPSAIQYLGVAASIQPENANHIYNMAVISDRAGDYEQAVKYYEQALEVDTVYGGGRSIPRDSTYERLAQIR